MQKMTKLTITLIAIIALFPALALANTADDPFKTELIAGQHYDVGEVQVWHDEDNLYVKFVTDEPSWSLSETHLHVAATAADVPQKKGNPIPGRFDYHSDHNYVMEYTYTIPLGDLPDTIVIAAHGVSQELVDEVVDLDGFAAALPLTAKIKVSYPGGDSYLNATITEGGALNGTYDDWCVDIGHNITPGTTYTANVYSSYETIPEGIGIDRPENLDKVNWVINQDFYGTASPGGYGNYTFGDIQRAIWTLIDFSLSTSGLGSWNQNRVNEIVAGAEANGLDFVPGCEDEIAVIFQPVNASDVTNAQVTIAQVTLAEVDLSCTAVYNDETAWGAGFDFDGKNWGMYFTYEVVD